MWAMESSGPGRRVRWFRFAERRKATHRLARNGMGLDRLFTPITYKKKPLGVFFSNTKHMQKEGKHSSTTSLSCAHVFFSSILWLCQPLSSHRPLYIHRSLALLLSPFPSCLLTISCEIHSTPLPVSTSLPSYLGFVQLTAASVCTPGSMAECKRGDGGGMSPSSSMDSSTHPVLSTTSSGCRPASRRDLSTDLQLGLSLSPASSSLLVAETKSIPSTPRNQVLPDWPPIKPFLRSALTASARRRRTLFVKVYMEGVPIGRKLDLLLLDGYDSLLAKLRHMFKTPITYKLKTCCHISLYYCIVWRRLLVAL
ncbi:hypothetical protein SETIT_5G033700v2 [Setaria italica]|uniref:Auxin-responsive protein n=2 Tax=Setaria italica TaxID=4555 RepID=A0A368R2P5_SETIT|nr:hypothetical protein SETIT_5G033700v2 [Setaria italica]